MKRKMRGLSSRAVCTAVGVTQVQLHTWAISGLLVPGVKDTDGPGRWRLYSQTDLIRARTLRVLQTMGLPRRMQQAAMRALADLERVAGEVYLVISAATGEAALVEEAEMQTCVQRSAGGIIVQRINGEPAEPSGEAKAA
jgi:DNA-binding transcriptional MerR regulator